jgi:eukaryotic-like serine/threonine-protein kinase
VVGFAAKDQTVDAPPLQPTPNARPGCYRFGLFELDPSARRLLKQGRTVRLQDQPFELLVTLVERKGEIVSREELRQRLWPDDTFVDFDKSLGVAVTKLRDVLGDSASSPTFIETVPRRGYRFIASVESTVDRQVQPNSPAAQSAALSTSGLPSSAPEARAKLNPRLVLVIGLSLVLFVVLVFAALFYSLLPGLRQTSAKATVANVSPVSVRRSVAVLGFRNLPGRREDDWLSQAFVEMLGTELAAGGKLRLVSDEDVARVKRELPLADEESLAKPTLERLRKNPGADLVVLGSYTPVAGKNETRLRLDIRVQDTASGDTVLEDAVIGDEANIFELAARAGADLRRNLGVTLLSREDVVAARASLPANEQAIRSYSEGKAKLWAFDYVGARDALSNAIAADPEFPLAHAALSDAWDHLGYRLKAISEARRALDLSQHLSREEQLVVAGQYEGTVGDWRKTVDTYRSLFALRPDSLDYGLRLAVAELPVSPADALRTVQSLKSLPPPANDDPRIDLMEASAEINQNFTAAKAAAKRAVAKGTAQGSPLIVGRAYGFLCQQAASVGVSLEEAVGYCEAGRQSAASGGDYNNEARTLSDLAALYFQQGDLLRAEKMWRDAAKEFRQVGDLEGLAATSNNLGDVFLVQGKLGAAKKMLDASIPSYRAIEDNDGIALALTDLAEVARLGGDLEMARIICQQAKAVADSIDDKNAQGYSLFGLGEILTDRGDLVEARKAYEQSLSLRNESGEIQAAGESRVALALLSIEEGRAADAESELRKRKDQFHEEREADDELTATAALVEALQQESEFAKAKDQIERSQDLAAKTQNILVRLQFDLTSARLLLASVHPESARPNLQKVLKQARGLGLVPQELETRLALAELEQKSGQSAAAKARLTSLKAVAERRGYGLIEKKAAAGLGQPRLAPQ